jgi:ribosomal protein L29
MAPKKKTTTSSEEKTLDALKTLDRNDLQAELHGARKDLYVLTIKKELGELKQSHLIRKKRRYIAQISTFLTNSL